MKTEVKSKRVLFTSMFTLSAFTIGGGYVIVPLMKKRFVDDLHWIEEEEMIEMIALGQSAPGPIAVNTSILLGYTVAGVPGALIALLGTALPPLILLSILSVFYEMVKENRLVAAMLRGMQAGIAAVITDVVIGMAMGVIKKKKVISMAIMVAAFLAAAVFDVNVAFVVIAAGVLGAIIYLVRTRREKSKKEGQA
jgi:chromate transporter